MSIYSFISTLIIFFTARLMVGEDKYNFNSVSFSTLFSTFILTDQFYDDQFPTGKTRFEPLGVLVFSVMMIASFVQVLIESLKSLFEDTTADSLNLPWLAIIMMLLTIGSKSIVYVLFHLHS